jgi:hypothetical protein
MSSNGESEQKQNSPYLYLSTAESEPHFEFVFERLLRKGYLLKGEGEAEFFSGEFRAFLSQKPG